MSDCYDKVIDELEATTSVQRQMIEQKDATILQLRFELQRYEQQVQGWDQQRKDLHELAIRAERNRDEFRNELRNAFARNEKLQVEIMGQRAALEARRDPWDLFARMDNDERATFLKRAIDLLAELSDEW